MALDTLTLGPFEFTDFAVPDQMPYEGKQHVVVHKLPGGDRIVDVMGPDDPDPHWEGHFWGADAASKAITLKMMCESGQELPLSWGMESRRVIILEFHAHVIKFNCIHYSITCLFTDNPYGSGGGGGGGGGFAGAGGGGLSLDGMVGADLGSAQDLAEGNFSSGLDGQGSAGAADGGAAL